MKYFTADSHFSLKDNTVIPRDFRPFGTLEEMNNSIINIWNEQAGENDVIYHLGDFVNYNSFDNTGYDECFEFVKKIRAKVVLILGNNEDKILNREFGGDFEKFKNYLLAKGFSDVIKKGIHLKIGEHEYYLTHCPRDCEMEHEYNLFGHVHKCVFVKKFGYNVGVDNHYFKLFSVDDILDLESRRKYFDENVYA